MVCLLSRETFCALEGEFGELLKSDEDSLVKVGAVEVGRSGVLSSFWVLRIPVITFPREPFGPFFNAGRR